MVVGELTEAAKKTISFIKLEKNYLPKKNGGGVGRAKLELGAEPPPSALGDATARSLCYVW